MCIRDSLSTESHRSSFCHKVGLITWLSLANEIVAKVACCSSPLKASSEHLCPVSLPGKVPERRCCSSPDPGHVFFSKIHLLFYQCVSLCASHAYKIIAGQKRTSNSLGLEWQEVVRCHVWPGNATTVPWKSSLLNVGAFSSLLAFNKGKRHLTHTTTGVQTLLFGWNAV